VKICRPVWPVSEFLKKGHRYKKFCYISPICRQSLRGQICTKFGIAIGVTNIITCDKFFGDWLRGVNSVGGPNFAISHWQPSCRYHRAGVLLTHGWFYCSAHDGTSLWIFDMLWWNFQSSEFKTVVKTCCSSKNVDAESLRVCMRAWMCICVCNGLGWCDNWISGTRHCHWLWAQWRFNIAYLLNSTGLLLLAYSYTLQSYGTVYCIWYSGCVHLTISQTYRSVETLRDCHFRVALSFLSPTAFYD